MKKLLLSFLMLIALFGCGNTSNVTMTDDEYIEVFADVIKERRSIQNDLFNTFDKSCCSAQNMLEKEWIEMFEPLIQRMDANNKSMKEIALYNTSDNFSYSKEMMVLCADVAKSQTNVFRDVVRALKKGNLEKAKENIDKASLYQNDLEVIIGEAYEHLPFVRFVE